MRFPRTKRGWRALFWILIRRCPSCHGGLCQDWAMYDDDWFLWCLRCGGMQVPKGMIRALILNERAYLSKEATHDRTD